MTDNRASQHAGTRVRTGLDGLDEITHGGFLPSRNYMIRGPPGAGKTLVGLHFLAAGVADGEQSLFINMGEAEQDIHADAASFGFDLDDVAFLDLSPSSDFFAEDQSYDVFPSAEVEPQSMTDTITEHVADVDPDRVFVDPLTQFRYLSTDDYQFRKRVLSFLRFLKEQACTVLFTSQNTATTPDDDLQFMSDGIVSLDVAEDHRTIEVTKFRGSDFESGRHGVRITGGGMDVFPKLSPGYGDGEFDPSPISSGVTELDNLLKGGLDPGTVTIFSGPSGVGKTTIGTQFATQLAAEGSRAVVYLFEESERTFRHRTRSIGIPVDDYVEDGTLRLEAVHPGEMSTEEFGNRVRAQVERHDAEFVMVDGIDGYRHALVGDDEHVRQLHRLGSYLRNRDVTAVMTTEVSRITGQFEATDQNVSYLADNLVFLRYLEYRGEMRKAIGVLKKRASDFERTLREFEITGDGIAVGEPLTDLRGILEGTPDWTDDATE